MYPRAGNVRSELEASAVLFTPDTMAGEPWGSDSWSCYYFSSVRVTVHLECRTGPPRPPPWPVESGVRLFNPPQLFCLLIGDLPGFSDECRLRNRRPSIDLLWETLAMKLSRVRRLIVPNRVPRSRQGNYDLTILHFDVKIVGGSPASC